MTDAEDRAELTSRRRLSCCGWFKNTYSMALLIFSTSLITGLIFTRQTKISKDAHPVVALVVMLISLVFLSMVEGGQASLVGLAPINFDLYRHSHPVTYKSTGKAHKGDNLDRYLMGRQFMVIFFVFVINLCGGPLEGATLWNLPTWLFDLFMTSQVGMILVTVMAGQVSCTVNASHCMLDYINNYFAVLTFWFAMAIEVTGLLHTAYVIQLGVAKLAGKPIESSEPQRSAAQNIFFWFRVLLSFVILVFSLAVTIEALFQQNTTIWAGIPGYGAIILFFVLMCIGGMLEGMQIAFFAVANLSRSERGRAKFAMKTCDLLYRGEGRNLPGFMTGRQMCVTTIFFITAKVTSLNIEPGTGENIFDVNDGTQYFLNLGFLGAVITTILGSISWQLVASAFPLGFLSNPLVYIFLRFCLLLEFTGICSGAWFLAGVMKKIYRYQRDEIYLGSADQRARQMKGDNNLNVKLNAGRPRKLPGIMPETLSSLMKHDVSVMAFVQSLRSIVMPKSDKKEKEKEAAAKAAKEAAEETSKV